jgi:hypothetical protein
LTAALVGSNKRIGEHRVVAYEHVGDAVIGHHVDHDNADRSDNRWENLVVLTPGDHSRKTWASEGMGNAWAFVKWLRAEKPDLLADLLAEYRTVPQAGRVPRRREAAA